MKTLDIIVVTTLIIIGCLYVTQCSEVSHLRKQHLEDAAALSELRKEEKRLRLGQAAAQSTIAGLSSPSSAAPAVKPAVNPDGLERELVEDPHYLAFKTLDLKQDTSRLYHDFFKDLNLSPQRLDDLKNAIVNRWVRRQQMYQMAFLQGIDEIRDPAGVKSLQEKVEADSDAEIRAIVGDAALAQFRADPGFRESRRTVGDLQVSLSYTEAPLTDDQAQQLVQILKAQDPDPTRTPFESIAESTVTQASHILSEPQMQALRELQKTQMARQRMWQMEKAVDSTTRQ